MANYTAKIKVHPNRNFWELFTDSEGEIIVSNSFTGLYNRVKAKYGTSEFVIMKDVKYVTYPPERLDL